MVTSFNEIPTNIRVPGQYVEFDNSNAMQGLTQLEYKVLFIGQKTSDGSAETLKAEIVTSYEQAKKYYGAGSQLALMVEAFRKNDSLTKLYCLPLEDDASSVAATCEIEITGTVSVPAPLLLYIGGKSVRITASLNSSGETIMQDAALAINLEKDLPVTAAYVDSKLKLTAKNSGDTGNEVDVRISYYDEIIPSGIAVNLGKFSGGAGNPDIADALAVLGDDWYHVISMPYTDRANLRQMEDELLDRWGPLRHIDGLCFTAKSGTFGELISFGTDDEQSNYQNIVILETIASPDLPYVRAAACAGIVAFYGSIDQARPFQTLALQGCLAPKKEDRTIMMEQDQLLYSGIATTYVDEGGMVRVQRLVTNYMYSASGAVDTSYLDINTKLTLSYLRYDFRNRLLRKYPRHKLASDASMVSPGQAIMTPKLGKAEAVSACEDWMEVGLVENMAAFKDGLICEVNALDPNRLDWRMTPDLVNQFRIGATQIQFLL